MVVSYTAPVECEMNVCGAPTPTPTPTGQVTATPTATPEGQTPTPTPTGTDVPLSGPGGLLLLLGGLGFWVLRAAAARRRQEV